jgi:hypothetical protein
MIMQTWVAYNHTVHYLVDLDNEEVIEVEIPGWMNTFESPEVVWSPDSDPILLTDRMEERIIEVLENSSMPDPTWG